MRVITTRHVTLTQHEIVRALLEYVYRSAAGITEGKHWKIDDQTHLPANLSLTEQT